MTYIPILTDPTEFNGSEPATCERCHNILTPEEDQEEQKKCFECIEEQEERPENIDELIIYLQRKELEKQFLKFPELEEDQKINLKAQKDALNKIFDSFSIAIIGSFDKDGNLI